LRPALRFFLGERNSKTTPTGVPVSPCRMAVVRSATGFET
jgi:hypothetical protein